MSKISRITHHCSILHKVSTSVALFPLPISSQITGLLNSSNLYRVKPKKQLQLKMINNSTLISIMRMERLRLSLKKKSLKMPSQPKVRRSQYPFMLMIQIITHIRSINISIMYKTNLLLLTIMCQITQSLR